MPTKIINNFNGRLTRDNIGDMDSGMAKYLETFGADPFSNIGNLTWLENPTQIDPGGAVITDLIVAQKTRLESGVTYVYAVGHTGRVYKIQVNDPAGNNPNLDTPVLLTTLSSGSPTFKYGTSIQFYPISFSPTVMGIYIFWDSGVTSIHFDGTGERYIPLVGGNYPNTARPSVQFNGAMYWGDGNNLAIIDVTLNITSTPIVPSLPYNVVVRDLNLSVDGNYLEIIASEILAPDMTTTAQDTSSLSSGNSYKCLWNGIINTAITEVTTYNSYGINAAVVYGNNSFTIGYDLGGMAVYSNSTKILSLPDSISPNINAKFSTGNLLAIASPETSHVQLKSNIMFYGQFDEEVTRGIYRFLRLGAQGSQTDVIQIPCCGIVSNLFYGPSSSGYPNLQIGSAKLYFSTLETSGAPSTAYKYYKFTTVPTGLGTAIQGVYETQNQTSFSLFKGVVDQKFKTGEIRLYTEPLVANNSFKIDLIGSDGNPISGGTQTFTVGTNVTAGQDYVWYTPQTAPMSSIGVRITNLGTKNWTGLKMEIDYEQYGK